VSILHKEQTTAADLAALVADRDQDMTETKDRQAGEMQNVMDNLDAGIVTAHDVNLAAERHHNEAEMVKSMWDTQISSLHETRRAEFRSWIVSLKVRVD
jgi:hypothetical protein